MTKPDGTTYQRRIKSDFPTLYTEIHSHPMTAADYKSASREEKARVHQWAKLALSDFAKRMPKGVKFAAVLHLDEGHVHFHILALNMADPKMSANKLHVGKIAAEDWRRENGRAETLTFTRIPRFLQRTSRTPPDQRSPVQLLVGRFVGLIRRAAKAIGGGPEAQRDEPEARPEP